MKNVKLHTLLGWPPHVWIKLEQILQKLFVMHRQVAESLHVMIPVIFLCKVLNLFKILECVLIIYKALIYFLKWSQMFQDDPNLVLLVYLLSIRLFNETEWIALVAPEKNRINDTYP